MATIEQVFQDQGAQVIRRYHARSITTAAAGSAVILQVPCELRPAIYYSKATLIGYTSSGNALTGDIDITDATNAIDGATGVATLIQTELSLGDVIFTSGDSAFIGTITNETTATTNGTWNGGTLANESFTHIWRSVVTWEGIHGTVSQGLNPYPAVDPAPTNLINEAGTLEVAVTEVSGVPTVEFSVETTGGDTSHGGANANTTVWHIVVEQSIVQLVLV